MEANGPDRLITFLKNTPQLSVATSAQWLRLINVVKQKQKERFSLLFVQLRVFAWRKKLSFLAVCSG
jgi:hypothetical protein